MAMKPGMMMVMDQIDRQQRYPRSEYGNDPNRRMIGYDRDYNTENRRRYAEGDGWQGYRMAYDGMDPESRRRRDSRGRYMEGDGWEGNGSRYEHDGDMRMGGYGTGYNGSYNGGYGDRRMEPESRRRRDRRGRYMMDGMDDDDEYDRRIMDDPPHMRGGSRYGFGDVYAEVYAPNAMNRPMGGGMHGGDMSQPVDEHTARTWVEKMDGGEHFKPEQTEQLRTAMCPDCHKWEFFVAMNAMYSDHCETAKKVNMDKPEFYAHLAKDFLKDSDAKPHKLRRYMENIPK